MVHGSLFIVVWGLMKKGLRRLITGVRISLVMINKIDKIKKIADIKIEKRGKKWLVN